jgi:hypothetical protein
MSTKSRWNNGMLEFYDGVTYERVRPLAPVVFEDDFLGAMFGKNIAGENTTALWKTVETDINLAPALVANDPNGVVQITLDTDDITQQGAVYLGDQLPFSMKYGLVWEARLRLAVLPAAGGEHSRAVFGLASATNGTLDSIATNAWFRVESAANTALLWETDDGNTDDDDNAAGVVMAAATWNIFRIDCTNLLTGIKFYVDNVLVGTSGDMDTNLTAGEALVQPYFCMQKTKAAANTAVGTMYIDYCRMWQKRS